MSNTREPFKTLTSKTIVLNVPDIDTDQIIPARFLTTTSREGLGKHAFQDWRYEDDGVTPNPNFVLNKPIADGARILIAGRNFGCGSSREHAPWALLDYGFKAVISTEIADIFRGNALKNGLLPIVVDEDTHKWLVTNEGAELTIDLEARELHMGDMTIPFAVEAFARTCLLQGVDELGYIQSHMDDIKEFEATQEHA